MPAGYSGTPLVKKLGIKPGFDVLVVNAPMDYTKLLGSLPEEVDLVEESASGPVDFIHLFAPDAAALEAHLPGLKEKLDKNGLMWVSWIKKSSRLKTDITGNDVRARGLETGLVDVKVCAVDKDWSGLKFVYRKEDR